MNLIANISLNNCIGNGGKLVNYDREDMRRFKALTTDGVVIMGANTFRGDLHSRKLPDRVNIIITRNKGLTTNEQETFFIGDINTAISVARSYDKPIWIIGGSSIYTTLLPHVTKLFITHTNNVVNGDKYLNIDWSKWNRVNEVKLDNITFADYDLRN
jgi:dihydrofolate reductase